MRFVIEIMFILNAMKSHFKGIYINNRILNEWSFHMKIMKHAAGLFHKFQMKWPLVLEPLFQNKFKFYFSTSHIIVARA